MSNIYWNYFLALESDLHTLSRFVEICQHNYATYSIELAHLLFAASSEVDVIAKGLCQIMDPAAPRSNICQYRSIVITTEPRFPDEAVQIPRYGLILRPWQNWYYQQNPGWWHAYNNVKHNREQYFYEANLENAVNAIAGLLVIIFYYYSYYFSRSLQLSQIDPKTGNRPPLPPKEVTKRLLPESELLRLRDDYYYKLLTVGG